MQIQKTKENEGSGRKDFAKMFSAAVFDSLQTDLARADPGIFHGWVEEARDPADADANEPQFCFAQLVLGRSVRSPSSRTVDRALVLNCQPFIYQKIESSTLFRKSNLTRGKT